MTVRSSHADRRGARVAQFTGLGALALVLGALGFQYLDGVVPCEMCHWQRWPHIAATILGLLVVPLWNKRRPQLAMTAMVLATAAGLIAAWHWDMLKSWQPDLLALVIVALVAVAVWKKDARLLAVIAIGLVAISGLIGAYQTGMQLHLLPGPQACTAPRYILGSNAPPPVIDCNVVTWSLFGLSLAAYNAIFSFLIAGTAALALKARA